MRNLVREIFDIRRAAGALLSFFWARKLWWMVPLVAVFLLFLVLIVLAGLGGAGPFDYTLF